MSTSSGALVTTSLRAAIPASRSASFPLCSAEFVASRLVFSLFSLFSSLLSSLFSSCLSPSDLAPHQLLGVLAVVATSTVAVETREDFSSHLTSLLSALLCSFFFSMFLRLVFWPLIFCLSCVMPCYGSLLITLLSSSSALVIIFSFLFKPVFLRPLRLSSSLFFFVPRHLRCK